MKTLIIIGTAIVLIGYLLGRFGRLASGALGAIASFLRPR